MKMKKVGVTLKVTEKTKQPFHNLKVLKKLYIFIASIEQVQHFLECHGMSVEVNALSTTVDHIAAVAINAMVQTTLHDYFTSRLFFFSVISHVKIVIGERSEPHTYRTVGKNLRHIYIYVFNIYIYIYIYIYIRSYVVHARATRKRRTGRLRFNGQYNRLKNGYFSSKL